jgi:SAM-dependent methyltransferase
VSESTRSASLGERYSEHNRQRGRGFLYGGQDRVNALRAAIDGGTFTRVLDLGCRDGALARALGLPPGATIGADIDPEALVNAHKGGTVRATRADLWGPFPFREEAFDLVVAGEIMEHVPFPAALVAEVSRVLAPGGRFVGSVPNAFRLKNRLMFLFGRWFEPDPTHLRQFSPGMLHDLLAGQFTSVSIRPCVGRWTALSPRLMANDLVWRAIKG